MVKTIRINYILVIKQENIPVIYILCAGLNGFSLRFTVFLLLNPVSEILLIYCLSSNEILVVRSLK